MLSNKLLRGFLLCGIFLQPCALPFCASTAYAQKDKPDASERKALAYYANAADYQNNGAFELAIDEWQKLVSEYPKHSQASTAWHHLGVCNLQREKPDYRRAIEAFTEALKDKDLEIREETLINLSWALLTQARSENADSKEQKAGLSEARTRMVEYLKTYGDGGYVDQALFYLGDIEHLVGNRDQATAYYKKLLDTQSLSNSSLRPDATYALAVAFEEENKFAEAKRRYTDFQSEFPEHRLSGEVRLRMADLLLRENKPAEAQKLLSQIPTGKDDAMADYALLRLGYALELQGNSEEALKNYTKLLETFPDSKHVLAAAMSVGQARLKSNQFDEAVTQFQKVFESGGAQAPDAAHGIAIALMRQNKPKEAIELLEKAIKLAGKSPVATTLKMDYADALYAIPTEIEKARAAYEALATENAGDPLAPRAAYNAAFAALQTGKVADARRWAETFLARYPQDPLRNDVAYVAAEALLLQGEHAASAEAYGKLIAADPSNPSLDLWQLRLGVAYYLGGKYKMAIEKLAPLVAKFKLDAQKAEAQFILGASYLYEEDAAQAIDWLTASHKTSDQWAAADETLLLLAEAQERNKDNKSARETLELLLKKYPNSRHKAKTQYKLAQLSAANGELDAAIEGYRTIVKDNDASSYHNFANYGIAWCLMQQEKYGPALAQLTPILDQNLRDSVGSEAKLAEGVCFRKLGKVDEAIASLTAFLDTKPTGASLSNGLYELGLAFAEKGKLDQSTQQFERIVRETPEYPALDKVLYELAWNYQENGKPADASKYFEQIATKFPSSEFAAEATYMRAEQQYEAKQFDDATATYTSVLSSTNDPTMLEKAQYKLGWSLFQQARYPQAASQFDKQTQSFPAGKLAVDAFFMTAECDFKQDAFEKALNGYTRARSALERNAEQSAASAQVRALIYLHAGQCCRELKRWDECESWLKVVIDRYSDSPFLPTALYEMGYCKQNQNKVQEALAHYSEVASDYRTEVAARARFMMGEVYFSQRDFVKAIPEFQRVMFGFGGEKAPEDIKNWQAKSAFEAARCSEVLIESLKGAARKKVVDTATEFYEFIVQKHAAHELAAKAQTRLGELQKLR